MKKYGTWILVGIIVLLAAVLAGVLIYLYNQPPQQRAVVSPIVEIKPMEPDSSIWGQNFPLQWETLQKTETNNTDTTFGGSSKFSHLERDPRQVVLFTGNPFSKEYNDDRGHMNAVESVNSIKRINEKSPATCYSCKSSNNPALWDQMGMEDYGAMLFSDMKPNIQNSIGCANCHDAGTMRLIVTNPALQNALEAQGKDWTTFTRQEMRTVVCANCHVEYYFAGDKKFLTFPWEDGTRIDQIIKYYNDLGFKDWEYPETGIPMLKAQHPEYEMFTAGSTHYNAGVACADCHMPYVRDGAAKYSSHDVHSPLLNPELACGQCHTDTEYVVNRVNDIQTQVYNTKLAAEDALIDSLNAIKLAAAKTNIDISKLDEARQMHREAQFMWDFVSAENSMGFHNPEYILKILADSTNLARQAQMKATEASGDPSLLLTGYYYTIDPPPTPFP
jgi:nitrite reductase (cytochrome c-552)